MIKKMILFVLTISMILCSVNIVLASETMIISLESNSSTVKPGQQFDVKMSIKNNPGIAGFTLKIKFDKNVITPVTFSNNSQFTALTTIDSSSVDLTEIDTINITYDSLNTISTNGLIGTFSFKVKSNILSDFISIDWVDENGLSVYDKNLNDISFRTENVVLAIDENNTADLIVGDADTNNTITANDAAIILAKVLDKNKSMPIEEKLSGYMKYVDVDGDGAITAKDAAMVFQKALDDSFKF